MNDTTHGFDEPRRARSLLTIAGVGLTVLAGGCPRPASSTLDPQAVLRAYAREVDAGRYEAAYKLMSLEFRKRHDRESFVRMLKENPDQLKASLAHLHRQAKEVEVVAKFDYGDGETMRMVVENGRWKIATSPVDFYSQRTPAKALRSFIRAIERHRYDIVMRFVPSKWISTMTESKLRQQWEGAKRGEVEEMLKRLKANISAPIRQTGSRATMPYGGKHVVRFIREDGAWKIEDPD